MNHQTIPVPLSPKDAATLTQVARLARERRGLPASHPGIQTLPDLCSSVLGGVAAWCREYQDHYADLVEPAADMPANVLSAIAALNELRRAGAMLQTILPAEFLRLDRVRDRTSQLAQVCDWTPAEDRR